MPAMQLTWDLTLDSNFFAGILLSDSFS